MLKLHAIYFLKLFISGLLLNKANKSSPKNKDCCNACLFSLINLACTYMFVTKLPKAVVAYPDSLCHYYVPVE